MKRRFHPFAILLVLIGALASTPAWAQVQTGSIFVRATDEQGAAVPGATITLTSPVLPQPLTGVTDSTGAYRFQALSIGRYTVRIALTGFQTINREDVVVVQNQTTSIDFALKLGAVTEEVTVTGESPVVDAKSATVNVNLDAMLLETTPGGKDIWNILEYKIPGLTFAAPDVGGNQAGLQRAFTTRGTPNSQNVQLVNGVNVGDPAAIGFSMNYYEPSTFENIQVTTGAQDISMGTSGVLINMVTRSGTNRFGGQSLFTYQGEETQWDNIDEDLKLAGFRPEANAVGFISNFNVQAGGPFVQNKLFYFGSFNDQRTHVNVPGYPAISPPELPPINSGNTQDTTDITSMSGKMTYALNTSNRFEGYANRQWYDKPNRGAGANNTLDSNPKEYDTFVITQVSWNTVLTSRLVADTKLAYSNTHFPLSQKTDRQTILDESTNVRHWNNATNNTMFRRRLQITSNWNYFLSNLAGGRHEFRFGIDNGYTPEDVRQERQGDVALTYRSLPSGSTPAGPQTVEIFNTPSLIKRAVNQTSLYAQDSYSVGRLTVIGGIRWERVEGIIPEQERLPNQYFPPGLVINGLDVTLNTGGVLTQYVVPERFAAVHDSPLWKNWAPRVSGTYDLFGTGRSVVKASAGKYLDQIGTGTPGPNPNGTVSQEYTWVDVNGDLQFQPGAAVWDGFRYVGGEFGPGEVLDTNIPNPNPFDRTLRRPYRNEFTVGIDQEILTGLGLSVTYIRRREYDSQGSVDAEMSEWDNRYTPVTVAEPGRDGRFNTADDGTITVYSLNTGATTSARTVNDDRLGVRYNGIEINATKRYRNGLTFLAGYTYGKEKVELTSLNNPNAARVNVDGLSGGRRHNLKFTGSYLLPYRITIGGNFNIASGLPITRTWQVTPRCSSSVRTGCVNQNVTVNAEPRGSVELPRMIRLDLRAGRLFDVGGQRFELSADFYNVTNANTVFNVRTGTGLTNVKYANDPNEPTTQVATFMSPTGALGPRIIRFNVTYWFGQGASAAGRR
jgi:hypothetical protein